MVRNNVGPYSRRHSLQTSVNGKVLLSFSRSQRISLIQGERSSVSQKEFHLVIWR